jgi:hypothetical protein
MLGRFVGKKAQKARNETVHLPFLTRNAAPLQRRLRILPHLPKLHGTISPESEHPYRFPNRVMNGFPTAVRKRGRPSDLGRAKKGVMKLNRAVYMC